MSSIQAGWWCCINEQELPEGVIIRGRGGFYTVLDGDGTEHTLRCKKKFKHIKMTPMVGDRVLFIAGSGEENGWIEEILERKNSFIRPPVANVDAMINVLSPIPQPDLLLLDRMLVFAFKAGVTPLIVVNKSDIDEETNEEIRRQYLPSGIEIMSVSAEEETGLDELKSWMKGKICCFSGQSGVGKSSILSRILHRELETGSISEKIERGKNTTRHSELLISKDGIRVMDTPGFSLLELEAGIEPSELQNYYPEISGAEMQCRFSPCYHQGEPDCGIKELLKNGGISRGRYERYLRLLSAVTESWRNRYD